MSPMLQVARSDIDNLSEGFGDRRRILHRGIARHGAADRDIDKTREEPGGW
jgi:hypothetical protein